MHWLLQRKIVFSTLSTHALAIDNGRTFMQLDLRGEGRKEKVRLNNVYLSEFVEFSVRLHAAESDFGEGLASVGSCQRTAVKDGTAARLFG